MKNYLILFVLLFIIIFSSKVFAENEKQGWKFVKDTDYCFIQSHPIKTDIPEGKIRGDHYILVYRMNKNPDSIIQITAGYNYKSSESVSVMIDKGEYDFYTDEDTAWAKQDSNVIFAMKKGLELITTGFSTKGTKVVDTYSLKGFTLAFNKLTKDC